MVADIPCIQSSLHNVMKHTKPEHILEPVILLSLAKLGLQFKNSVFATKNSFLYDPLTSTNFKYFLILARTYKSAHHHETITTSL